MLEPIYPFEPIYTDEIVAGKQWVSQIKWDGVRILTYAENSDVFLYNRKKHERTYHYPELLRLDSYCKAKSAIFDGEVIALGENGKPSFHQVMKRDGIRRLEKVKQVQTKVPIYYMIFDILYCNGKWLHDLPLIDRFDILCAVYKEHELARTVPLHSDAQQLYEAVKSMGMEGIVMKDKGSAYSFAGKDGRWLKKKVFHDLIAVVGGVTYRHSIVNSLLLGLYDEKGRFIYIGKAGAGKLTNEEWRTITTVIDDVKAERSPFFNLPEPLKGVTWLVPTFTVKISFLEWTAKQTLRQPAIQAFVITDPKQCTFLQ